MASNLSGAVAVAVASGRLNARRRWADGWIRMSLILWSSRPKRPPTPTSQSPAKPYGCLGGVAGASPQTRAACDPNGSPVLN
jgi:hypothetical protein